MSGGPGQGWTRQKKQHSDHQGAGSPHADPDRTPGTSPWWGWPVRAGGMAKGIRVRSRRRAAGALGAVDTAMASMAKGCYCNSGIYPVTEFFDFSLTADYTQCYQVL